MKRLKDFRGAILLTLACLGGASYLWIAHASAPTVSVEAENGSVSSAAQIISDSSASGGKAVKFGNGTSKPAQLARPFYFIQTSAYTAYNNATDPTTKHLLWQIAGTPMARWLGVDTNQQHFTGVVSNIVNNAAQQNATPVFVLYAIPDRDCGNYSAGGFPDKASYEQWIDWFTSALGNSPALVIVEPDAIALCGTDQEKADRIAMLKYDMDSIGSRDPNAYAYIHVGSGEVPINSVVSILTQIDAGSGRGFALNVSSFGTTASQESYGDQLSAALAQAGMPNMHYIVDTSRNGLGRDTSGNGGQPEWCNPPGRALGTRPTTQTDDPLADAYLWIKTPGESDGNCHAGDPTSGGFFQSYATGLAQRALDNNTVPDLPTGTYYTGN